MIDHQSATTTPVSCGGQDAVAAADGNSISQARFSGERVLVELWPILLGSVDVSETLSCCPGANDSGMPSQPAHSVPRCNNRILVHES